eukprot:SM007969S22521  [mRNA]  locus=s7969:15:601:+ [translate_table: standard]
MPLLPLLGQVFFQPIPTDVVDELIKEGEIFYAAGGLLVEHRLVAPLVKSTVGTIDSIMGLPKLLTQELMDKALSEESG